MKIKSKFVKNLISITIVTVVSMVIPGLLSLTDIFKTTDYQFNNVVYRLTGITNSEINEVTIVTIDDQSLIEAEKIGVSWPWPREMYGMVAEFLIDQGAKAVGLDMIFTNPDIDRINVAGDISDSNFHSVLVNTDRTIIGFNIDNRFERNDEITVREIPNANRFNHISEFKYIFAPYELFRMDNRNFGFVDIYTDIDGTIREYRPFVKINDKYYPSLALATLLAGNGQSIPDDFELNRNGSFILKWYGPGGERRYNESGKLTSGVFDYYPIWTVFQYAILKKMGREINLPPETFKDRYIFIGASARSLFDIRQTPFTLKGESYPGVEVHATALTNMLYNEHKKPVETLFLYSILILISLGLAYWGTQAKKIARYTIAVIVITGLGIFTSGLLFIRYDIIVSVSLLVITLLLTFVLSFIINYINIGKNRNALRKTFGTYMSPDLLKKIVDSDNPVSTNGEAVNATAFFLDIEGFTTFSEKNTPERVVEVLNIYLNEFSDIIIKNKGYVNKFLGDGLMALFGSPENYPDHSDMAIRSAVECFSISDKLKGTYGLNVRIGINSGKMIAGSMGGLGKKLEFTAIGDCVNTASRLEGANKFFETKILIGEKTYDELINKEGLIYLGKFALKGKDNPISIYQYGEYDNDYLTDLNLVVKGFEENNTETLNRITGKGYDNGPIKYYTELYKKTPASAGKPVKLTDK